MVLTRILGRAAALLIIILIIPSTACAFWLYNANRTALQKTTYQESLQTSAVYTDLAVALLASFVDSDNKPVPRDANIILRWLQSGMAQPVSAVVLTLEQASQVISRTLDSFFDWLGGTAKTLETSFDLRPVKTHLGSDSLKTVLGQTIQTLPPCSAGMTDQLRTFSDTDSFNQLPICRPESAELVAKLQNSLVNGFGLIAAQLPDQWRLADEIELDNKPAPPTQFGRPLANAIQPRANRPLQLEQFRAFVTLQSRLLALLFLIPIALLFIIIIVTIRSLRGFLRWVGWALVVSGIFSLVPLLLITSIRAGLSNGNNFVNLDMGSGSRALGVVVVTMIQALISQLSLAVLVQVAGLIVVGLVLVFISLVLPIPNELSDLELSILRKTAGEAG